MGTETTTAVQTTPKDDVDVVFTPKSDLQLAIAKGMDPATISKIMDLQERWEANQARKEYVQAMTAFKLECPAVLGKDKLVDFVNKTGGHTRYKHATIGAIVEKITPILSKHGLSISWETRQDAATVTVTCHVTHAGGHRESTSLTGPRDESGSKNPIQSIGSSVTYFQRYTMVCGLGLATADQHDVDDRDDDRQPVTMPTEKSDTDTERSREPNTEGQLDCPDAVGLIAQFIPKGSTPKGSTKPRGNHSFEIGKDWYSTLSNSLAATIGDLHANKIPARVKWRANGQWRDAVAVEAAGSEAVQ